MSVDTSGPKGYEYQYCITVLIALLKLEKGNELYVEKVGSEDATLITEEGVLEVQMKREQSAFDMSKFIEWTCHFQERKSDNNLLYRLQNDEKNSALFITKSRCSDEISPFIKIYPELSSRINSRIKSSWKESFTKTLESFKKFSSGTEMAKARNLFCQNQGEFFKKQNLTDISSVVEKISIWEKISDQEVDTKVGDLLNRKYHIPLSQTKKVYGLLIDEVKRGRDERNDILPYFKTIISQNQSEAPQIDENYLSRKEEETLLKEVTDKNVLLLTGLSHCGKSQIAKKIAFSFFEKGYTYKSFKSIDEARVFLNQNPLDAKIAIIDDPYGHIERKDNCYEITEELRNLVSNIKGDNKLIVTSRKEILLDSFEEEDVEECSLQNYDWNDLTVTNQTELLELFQQLPDRYKYDASVNTVIETGIINSTKNDILQIGELSYLLNSREELNDKNFNELKRIARSKVKSIAAAIKDKSNDETSMVLAALAMCGDTIVPIPLTELAFVLSKEEVENQVKSEEYSSFSVSNFGREKTKIKFPTRSKEYTLDGSIQTIIDYLEERRFIRYYDDASIVFTHPNYFETGRVLFFSTAKNKQIELLRIYKKSLLSFLPDTAFHATQQIPIFYKEIKERHRQTVIDLSSSLLLSLFPRVEDFNLIFLIKKLDELLKGDTDKENIDRLVYKTTEGSIHVRNVYWHEKQIPFISYGGSFLDNLFFEIDKEILVETEASLKGGNLVSAYAAWNYIKDREENKAESIDFDILKTLLQYNEAFLRKEVVIFSLSKTPIADKAIIETIFNDNHPDVIFTAIRKCFDYWNIYTEDEQVFLLDLILKAVRQKSVAVRAFKFITTFGKDYTAESIRNWSSLLDEEKKELWRIWSLIFPIILENHFLSQRFDAYRFSATMRDALEFVQKDAYLKLSNAWFDRIHLQLKEGKLLKEHELVMMDYILEVSKKDSEIRKEIFEKVLGYPETGFLIVNLLRVTLYWDNLSQYEKEFVFNLTMSDREDVRWIKAVILCATKPPEELVFKITGDGKLFEKSPDEVITIFPKELLKDCLRVYTGHPQPLWWYAVHHRNREFWKGIISHIITTENKEYLEICLEEFLGMGVNSFSERESDYITGTWRAACENSKDLTFLTKELIYYVSCSTINITCTKIIFDILLESARKFDREDEVISTIVENIELLQQTGHREDIYEIFDNSVFNEIYEALSPDFALYFTLEHADVNQEDTITFLTNLLEMMKKEKARVRFFYTFLIINNKINELKLSENLATEFRSLPDSIGAVGKLEKERIGKLKNYELENWLGVA